MTVTWGVLVPCLPLAGSMTLTWSLPYSGSHFCLETMGSKEPLRTGYLQVGDFFNFFPVFLALLKRAIGF